ncbi:MAG: HAMP domain-containing protein [Blastocatellia bacterium]|nr:HAMP domain-containing protein [Blastocatellia bacterium]
MNVRSIRFQLIVWYAGLLAAVFTIFCTTTYLGVRHYLKWTLSQLLVKRANQVGESLLVNIGQTGDLYVANEISKRYAPEINDRFMRVTQANGSVLYVSGPPREGSFDPTEIPASLHIPDQAVTQETQDQAGRRLLVARLPVTSRDGHRFLVEVGAPASSMQSVLQGLLLVFAVSLPVVVVLAGGGGYLLIRRALSPVDEITRSAEQITLHNLSGRLPVARTGDELERLSEALNRMISRLEEAFSHVSRFTADASHELRTPLTVLGGELEQIIEIPRLNPEVREIAGSALEETQRLTKIVENLLTISRLDAGEAHIEQVPLNLARLASETAEQMSLLAEDKHIRLTCETRQPVTVLGDRARLKQVVVNLLDNSIKFTPDGGTVEVKVKAEGQSAVLEIQDSGIGIPVASLPHIFERFYRADKARSRLLGGSGLGLSIVKSICTAHGGTVTVQSTEGQGSSFRVALPLAADGSEVLTNRT